MIVEKLVAGIEEAVARYGLIAIGLLIGTAAKYGLLLTEGKRLTLRSVVIDLLLLGMLGLLAVAISDWFKLEGNARVMCGALAAVSSDRLIRLARDRFLRSAGQHMGNLLPEATQDALVEVPAGSGEPERVRVQKPPADRADARVGASLRESFGGKPARPAEDQAELLRRLDRD